MHFSSWCDARTALTLVTQLGIGPTTDLGSKTSRRFFTAASEAQAAVNYCRALQVAAMPSTGLKLLPNGGKQENE